MSIHLLEQAALLKLQPSVKLAFMAFCDSADKETGVAFPGMDQILTWAGVGKSRGHEIIAELIDAGLLERVSAGRRGHRAEFRVFVSIACCALHQPFGIPESAQPDPSSGSAVPDANLGSGTPDAKAEGSVQTGDWVRLGSGLGPVQTGPLPNSLTTTTSPSGLVAAELPLDGAARAVAHPMSLNQRAQAITKRYVELVPLSRFPAILSLVKRALSVKQNDVLLYTDADVEAALVRLAEQGWSVTIDTLRHELEGMTPLRRAAAGLTSTERLNQDLVALEELARREGTG